MRSGGLVRTGTRSSALSTVLHTCFKFNTGLLQLMPGVTTIPMSRPIASYQVDGVEEAVTKLCKENRPHEAFEVLASLDPNTILLSRDPIYHLLQHCTEKKDLAAARRVHCLIISSGLESIAVLKDHLIRLFALCGSLPASNQVFLKLPIATVYTWNAIITAHAKLGEYGRVLDWYGIMQQNGTIMPDKVTFLCILQACGSIKAIELGRLVHEEIVATGLDSDLAIGSSLVHMYVQRGSLQEAHKVFDGLFNRDVVSWGVIISGYAQYGYDALVLELFEKIQEEGIQPDRGMFVSFLKSCGTIGDIEHGRWIHRLIKKGCFRSDIVLGSAIIDMYSACGSLMEACEVFDKMSNRDVVAWGAMISAYIHHGLCLSAIKSYENMQHEGIKPDRVIFLCILKACTSLGKLALGRLIHGEVIHNGLDSHVMVGNTLIDLYAKCGSLEEASNIFDKLSTHDAVSWDIIIAGYANNGLGDVAFEKFNQMKLEGLKPNNVTFICILKACVSLLAVDKGRLIHDEIIRSNLESDLAIGNAIVDMYARCQTLDEAHKVLNRLTSRDVVTWGVLIAGFAQNGDGLHTLDLFDKMLQEGITADNVAYLSAMKACGGIRALEEGRLIHDQIIRCEFESHNAVGNSLVDMYAKCGSLEEAHKVFNTLPSKDVVSWGALIGGYAQNGRGRPAFTLFKDMQQEGVLPDQATFVCVLKACGNIGAAQEGRLIHDLILRSRFASDKVIGNALVDMYVKCGSLAQAHKVFDVLASRDVVSWSAMIQGYAQHGHGHAALELYEKMQQQGIQPTRVLYLCTLKACVSIGAVGHGRLVHKQVRRSGLELDMAIGNTLIELYAKCGDLEEAIKVFEKLPYRDVVSWSGIMAGYASYGNCWQVTQCLQAMLQEGLKPDDMVFTSVLGACSNAGLLGEAFVYFKSMIEDHSITPNIEHYSCMIDVLGRAGKLKEAFMLAHTMPVSSDAIVWMSLLANCRTYGNVESGRLSFEQVQEMDQTNASGYVLLSNILADRSLWEDNNKILELKELGNSPKKHGMACTEVKNNVYEFLVGSNNSSRRIEEQKSAQENVVNPTFISEVLDIQEPTSLAVVQGNLNWMATMQVEYDSILKNHIWNLVDQPQKHKTINTKWVCKANHKSDDTFEKNKAWLSVDTQENSKRVNGSLGKEGKMPHLDLALDQEDKEYLLCEPTDKSSLACGYACVPMEMDFRTTCSIESCMVSNYASICVCKVENESFMKGCTLCLTFLVLAMPFLKLI